MIMILMDTGVSDRGIRTLLGLGDDLATDEKTRRRVRSDTQRWLVLESLLEGSREREIALGLGLASSTVALRLRELRADLGAFGRLLWQHSADGSGWILTPLSRRRARRLRELAEALKFEPVTVQLSMAKLLARIDPRFCERLLKALDEVKEIAAGDADAACVAHVPGSGFTIGSER